MKINGNIAKRIQCTHRFFPFWEGELLLLLSFCCAEQVNMGSVRRVRASEDYVLKLANVQPEDRGEGNKKKRRRE